MTVRVLNNPLEPHALFLHQLAFMAKANHKLPRDVEIDSTAIIAASRFGTKVEVTLCTVLCMYVVASDELHSYYLVLLTHPIGQGGFWLK